jgi:hypothetical protein
MGHSTRDSGRHLGLENMLNFFEKKKVRRKKKNIDSESDRTLLGKSSDQAEKEDGEESMHILGIRSYGEQEAGEST